jgi:Domain of unknown function (DUF4411)
MKPLCVDTSFLIDLWVEYHPPKEWPDLWDSVIPALIKSGLFFAPHEVYQELAGKAAPLRKWAYKNRGMFRFPDRDTCAILRDVLKNDPGCVDRYKRGPHADSLVVAMAKAQQAIAVTRERRDGTNPGLRKPRVHTLCARNKVECYVTVREFRSHIGWPSKEVSSAA